MDLQQQIFNQIPELLQDIEVTENNRASALGAAAPDDVEPVLIAAFTRHGGFQSQRAGHPFRGHGNSTFQGTRQNQQQRKFCRLCYLSGSIAYNSHDISTCRQLTRRDLEALQSRLNAASLDDTNDDPPAPFLVPGWDVMEDDAEEEDHQDQ